MKLSASMVLNTTAALIRTRTEKTLLRITLRIAVLSLLTCAAFANPSKIIRHSNSVPLEYVVVLTDGTPTAAVDGIAHSLASAYDLQIERVWPYSLQGFLCLAAEDNIIAMANDPRVKYIEQNIVGSVANLRASATQGTTWMDENGNPGPYMWHLDRLDELTWAQHDYTQNMCTEGRSIYAYVLDTGVFASHPEFEGRVVQQLDFTKDRTDPSRSWTVDTTNGCAATGLWHGTAVASILSGKQVGAAKAKIVSLKIMACDQTMNAADAITAVDWIANWQVNPYYSEPAIINHSGYIPVWDSAFQSYSDAVTRTVTRAVIPFFTSADNFGTDACRWSPNDRAYSANRSGEVFVAGGTGLNGIGQDQRWQDRNADGTPQLGPHGSNGGACVSIYAPAVDIFAARHKLDGGLPAPDYGFATGTSFSSPLAAALALRYIEREIAVTGVMPLYDQVYSFLLSQAVTPVYDTDTPQLWACALPPDTSYWYSTERTSCPTGFSLFRYDATSNTSNARMLYWDQGPCP